MQIAHEVITQKIVERQRPVERRRHQLVDHLVLHALFDVVNIRARDRLVQDLDDLRKQSVEFVVR